MKRSIQEIINSEKIISGEELKILRQHLGISQIELASRLGFLQKSTVSHYETGKNKIDVPLDYMMKGLIKEKEKLNVSSS
tara:strand:+ start:292 stop:531 length:240 start_codon:yes stop_codon:yes gene_type:complete